MGCGNTEQIFAIEPGNPDRYPVSILQVIEIEQVQNRDDGLQGHGSLKDHILQQMICRKFGEPVHEFFRSCGNLHYQPEKAGLKIS